MPTSSRSWYSHTDRDQHSFFVRRRNIPAGRKVLYSCLVSSIRSHNIETHHIRVTVGSEKLDFPGITTTTCVSLTMTKCLINSTVSMPSAKFMTLDIIIFTIISLWSGMSI